MYTNYLTLDTLAGLARSSDKRVTNLLTVQQLPLMTQFFGFLLYVINGLCEMVLEPPWGSQPNFNIK